MASVFFPTLRWCWVVFLPSGFVAVPSLWVQQRRSASERGGDKKSAASMVETQRKARERTASHNVETQRPAERERRNTC